MADSNPFDAPETSSEPPEPVAVLITADEFRRKSAHQAAIAWLARVPLATATATANRGLPIVLFTAPSRPDAARRAAVLRAVTGLPVTCAAKNTRTGAMVLLVGFVAATLLCGCVGRTVMSFAVPAVVLGGVYAVTGWNSGRYIEPAIAALGERMSVAELDRLREGLGPTLEAVAILAITADLEDAGSDARRQRLLQAAAIHDQSRRGDLGDRCRDLAASAAAYPPSTASTDHDASAST